MKARFQHIREARVLSFEVEPYTNIDITELPFFLEDLQYLRYNFEVFSAMSIFGLTTNEKEDMARVDTYLDTRDVCIAYQERTRKSNKIKRVMSTSKIPRPKIQKMKITTRLAFRSSTT
ncbi:hypothetical protein ACFX1T_033174 [Malus domestica]